MHIRRVEAGELERLREIERAAGGAFRYLGMHPVADDPPPSTVVLGGVVDRGGAWCVDLGPREGGPAHAGVVAYRLADLVDRTAHLEQVSVHPDHAGHGYGHALVEHLVGRARATGLAAVTLTTFVDVPWNAPYYRRLGFRVLDEAELGPGLRAIRATERAHGLDRWRRCAMRRDLGGPEGHSAEPVGTP